MITKPLNYDHEIINSLLKKINEGYVLTEEEHRILFNVIGLEKLLILNAFDGSYNTLKDLPDIQSIADTIAKENDEELQAALEAKMKESNDDIIEDLYVRLSSFYESLDELEDEIIDLDESTRTELQNQIDEILFDVEILKEQATGLYENKADSVHIHSAEEIINLEEELLKFRNELKDEYHLEECRDYRHPHPNKKFLDLIDEKQFNKWENKVNQKQLDSLQKQLDTIELDYVSRDEVIERLIASMPDQGSFVKQEDLSGLLNLRAYATHSHKLNETNGLIDVLNSKVDKEKNKTLIDGNTLAKLEVLLKQHSMAAGGVDQHYHDNYNELDSITQEHIDKWNAGVSAETVEDILKQINDLTFIPIEQKDYDNLSKEQKEDKNTVYIITDADSYEIENNIESYLTKEQVDVLVEGLLDKRLNNMRLERIKYDAYQDLIDNGELDNNVLYIIEDAVDIDTSAFLTKDNLNERISEPAASANRPAEPAIGQCYFDTTLGMPIWFNGSVWVDALGNEI